MTQAYNLSQLANNLNSSGQLDATDGLVNAVPVANGGTGATTGSSARTNLGAAASGANTDITSLSAPALGAATATTQATNDNSTKVATTAFVQSVFVLRSYISGLTLSTAGSSGTMSIAVGQAADSANAILMTLASSINKTTSAWAVGSGNGGIDTGTIANSTWYYFYAIRRPDTGVVDVIFSTSSTSPTLPTNYTQYRYIGAGLTNGSAQWVKFTQFGDEFTWDTPVIDYSAAGSTTAANLTLTVPRGRKMKAWLNANGGNGGQLLYLSDLSNSDLAPSITASPLAQNSGFSTASGASFAGGVWTNTSAQIRQRSSSTGTMYIATLGWTDLRGKDL